MVFLCILGEKFFHIMGFNSLRLLYTVTASWYSTYIGKGSHLGFLNRSEDEIY